MGLTLCQICSAFVSLEYYLLSENFQHNETKIYVFNSLTLLFVIYGIYVEINQMCGLRSKYLNTWNFADMISLFLSIIMIIAIFTEAVETTEQLRLLAAIAISLEILKIFDWFRLFDNTAFYVSLLSQAIGEIKYFIIITVTAMMLFGILMDIISMSSEAGSAGYERLSIFGIFTIFYKVV